MPQKNLPPKNLEEISLPIKEDLIKVEEVIQSHLKSTVGFVTSISEYVIRNGGKRIRPVLCLFSSRLAGASGQKVFDSAAAMEFFHTATLMHDDVVDNAKLRRGKPSANATWGNHVAVLVGDFFYCQASSLLVGTDNLRIIKRITEAMLATTEGEILEISKSNDLSTTEEDYLKIIHDKTAVLMSASCEIGGILGNVSEAYIQALAEYGRCLGIAFQLADDILDYISENEKFGKVTGTDLKEGKLTLPLIVALRHCNDSEKRIIKDTLIAETVEQESLKRIISIINQYEGLDYTVKLAKTYLNRAKESLQIFKPTLEREALLRLTDFVIERNQ